MPRCRNRLRTSLGFTLLELLMVLSLIGIASVFSIASVDRLSGRVDERRWSDLMQQSLFKLRNKAMMSGATVQARLDFDTGELLQVGAEGADRLMVLPTRFRFVAPTSENGRIDARDHTMQLYFYPNGTMDEAVFDLLLPSEGRRRFHLARFTGKIERTTVNDVSQ